jgi:peptidoglycan/xylan/chitin deacetylase (PgdA/CDA1 family)
MGTPVPADTGPATPAADVAPANGTPAPTNTRMLTHTRLPATTPTPIQTPLGGGVVELSSVGYEAGGSSGVVEAGSSFTLSYIINNTAAGPEQVRLGAAMAPSGAEGFNSYTDAGNEVTVEVPVGVSTVSRRLAVPANQSEGGYDVTWVLVDLADGGDYDRRTRPSYIWVRAPGRQADDLELAKTELGASSVTMQPGVVNRINGTFTVNNPGGEAARVVLKLQIRLNGGGGWISDWMNDSLVTVPRGSHSFTRSFAIPGYVATGSYDVSWSLVRPDFSGDVALSHDFGVLTINNPAPVARVGVPILMYHNVDTPAETGIWVTKEDFAGQMNYLAANGYNTIEGDDLYNYVYKGVALPSNPVWITMDDSAQNLYDNAYPVLTGHGQRASIYTVTQLMGKYNTWADSKEPQHLHMTWDMLREMHADRLSAEGHTRGHVHLPELTWEGQQTEIWGTAQDLAENIGGGAGTSFSYPFGEYSDATLWLTAHSGFRTGLTIRSGRQYTDDLGIYVLNRIYIEKDDTLETFTGKLKAP